MRRYVQRLAESRGGIRLAILFGSYARGDWKPWSDADLPQDLEGRWDLFYTLLDGLVVEPHAYTPEEFEGLIHWSRMTAIEALSEGLVLYAEPAYLERVRGMMGKSMKRWGITRRGLHL